MLEEVLQSVLAQYEAQNIGNVKDIMTSFTVFDEAVRAVKLSMTLQKKVRTLVLYISFKAQFVMMLLLLMMLVVLLAVVWPCRFL